MKNCLYVVGHHLLFWLVLTPVLLLILFIQWIFEDHNAI
jgi:hypothetical protein